MSLYVRNARTGDLGEVVTKDGQEVVIIPKRLGQAPIPYKPHDWIVETTPRRMSRLQAAEIAYLADQGLQNWLGDKSRAKKGWISLREEDRIEFCDKGPGKPPLRRLLWKCIMGALGPAMDGELL